MRREDDIASFMGRLGICLKEVSGCWVWQSCQNSISITTKPQLNLTLHKLDLIWKWLYTITTTPQHHKLHASISAVYSSYFNQTDSFPGSSISIDQSTYFRIQTQNGKIQTNFGPDFNGNSDLNQTTFWANSDFTCRIVPISDFFLFLGLLLCLEQLKSLWQWVGVV